jgi:hypothetical protein
MRALFSVIDLLVVVAAAVGMFAKKQTHTVATIQPLPTGSNTSVLPTTTSGTTVQQQSLQIQQQVCQSVKAALQQTRAVADDK